MFRRPPRAVTIASALALVVSTAVLATASPALAAPGCSVAYTKQWSLNATVAYADVRSKMRSFTTTKDGVEELHTDINFRPVVYTLSLGYSF